MCHELISQEGDVRPKVPPARAYCTTTVLLYLYYLPDVVPLYCATVVLQKQGDVCLRRKQ